MRASLLPLLFAALLLNPLAAFAESPAVLDSRGFRLTLWADDGHYTIEDKRGGVTWNSHPSAARFGEVTLARDGKSETLPLARCEVTRHRNVLEVTFHPVASQPTAWVRVSINDPAEGKYLEIAYDADAALNVSSVRLLDQALWVTDADRGAVLVPVREGLLVPADSGLAFTHTFDTYNYEGCHMAMLGVLRGGAAALLSWSDPYVAAELRSTLTNAPAGAKQLLTPSLVLRKSARAVRIEFLGRGDHNTVALAYREVARQAGWLVPWSQKLKGHPERAQLAGASNYKLWSTLDRQMNEDSSKEENSRVNWTFDEAAQVAEHLHRDLKLDRVLFLMGGWIRRGYDNQHPDILPTAPECGGDAAFADCARRVKALGYTFGLHDNYQDIYRDSPSWNEDLIMKTADGRLAAGGHWAGGRAYLTCSRKAVELAQRPQNLRAVLQLSGPAAYFIDTTYAAGLQECFDPKHPLTRADDMHWKQAISDYARDVFGIFGSECGREWAIPHADFFEGLSGVSGGHFHDANLLTKVGGTVVPLFELVYRDTIAIYGKYGYDAARAAEYVLDHISLGRPLNYHSVPPHLYWQQLTPDAGAVAARPSVAEVKQTGPRQFAISYEWNVEGPVADDWRVFVHFTDRTRVIKFQNDHAPTPAVSMWEPGKVRQGPFTVTVPEDLSGTFNVRIGLFKADGFQRASLPGDDEEHAVRAGRLKVTADRIEFEPPRGADAPPAGDPALFTRTDHGWAAGLHPYDRFVKNTHEILSPLNALTTQMPMTEHAFLTPDRKVQRTVFGRGKAAVRVIVNAGASDYRCTSAAGGDVTLPPYGFVIDAPTFAAFHASTWNGLRYDQPTLFTLRSEDGRPLARSRKVSVFHAFGDPRVRLRPASKGLDAIWTVERESRIDPQTR